MRDGVPLVEVRQALAYAQQKLNIDQLLSREELRAAGGKLFLDRYRELAMRQVILFVQVFPGRLLRGTEVGDRLAHGR